MISFARRERRSSAIVLSTAGLMTAIGLSTSAFGIDMPAPEVIYGDDDRRDVYDAANSDMMVELAKSTVVLVKSGEIRPHPSNSGMSRLKADTFGAAYGLCEDEPFRMQPNPGFCSGFLVAPDVIVTAGHCITSATECAGTSFVFDFGYLEGPNEVLTDVANNRIYRCKDIIAQAYPGGTQTDYAVVRIDRAATDRTPVKFRKQGQIAVGTDLTVIGHPAGLPTKISGGAKVRRNQANAAFFVANLDTYGGNSGSAVFNSSTGEVEGILVRGETDFTRRGNCSTSYRCTNEGCRGEDVTKATEFARFLEEAPTRPTRDVTTTRNNLALAIPDNDPAGVSAAFAVTDTGIVGDISVSVKITHPYVGDLEVALVNPEGLEVVLRSETGGAAADLEQTFGADGTSVPGLTQFRGASATGDWQLVVRDKGASDTGTLESVTLTLKVYRDGHQPN